MIRLFVLFAASLFLASCQSLLPKSFELPTLAERAPDPRICAPVEPEPERPAGAGVPEPVTAEEWQAYTPFERHLIQHEEWGRRGWAIVEIARERCR